MKVTFAGHQGWIFESGKHCVLLDVIYEKMGNSGTFLPVYPCRKLKKSYFSNKKLSLIISHEHSDHFNINTLMWHPKDIDVYIPFISSSSLRDTIQSLGFNVKIMSPFISFCMGDLKFTPLPSKNSRLEPDVYCLLVEDMQKGTSFLTTVDAVPHDNTIEWLKHYCPKRTLDNFTNNYIERLPAVTGLEKININRSKFSVTYSLKQFIKKFKSQNIIISGQGWCFEKSKHKFNNIFFSIPHQSLIDNSKSNNSKRDINIAELGDCFNLTGEIIESFKNKEFYQSLKSPNRDFDISLANSLALSPWTNQLSVNNNELIFLENFILNDYGTILGCQARKINNALYELQNYPETEPPFLLFKVKNGNTVLNYLYDFRISKFVKLPRTNKCKVYPFAIEIWASDFLAIIQCQEEPYLIYESSIREYNLYPDLMSEILSIELFNFFTPRYQPEKFKHTYQKEINRLSKKEAI